MLEAPDKRLKLRTYNVSAMSFTPEEVANEIKRVMPEFKITYKVCPIRQAIGKPLPNLRSLEMRGWSVIN